MDIYNIDGTLFKSVSLAKDAVHEQELMKSNFIRLTWNDRASETIPVGSFIVYEGVRYMLLEDYTPKQNRHRSFTYTPEFQHPVIWLSKIPFWQEIADPSDPTKTVRRYDWSYANYPQTISNYLASFIQGLGIEDLNDTEKEWTALVDERIQMTGVCAFSSVDVLSACSVIANTFDCQFNIDFEAKQIRFGNPDEHFSLRFDGTGYEAPVLKSGQNVGVASVTETKEEYHNAYLVQGSTRNLSKKSDSGDPVQVTERLTLLPDANPDSIIYLNGDTEVTKEQFDALGVPMLFKSLIFDDIYPKYNLFLYNIRERRRWLIDSSTKEKISATQSDGWEFEGGYYKYYSEWYFRLAYYTNAPIAGKSTIHTESKEGKTYYWYDYDLTDEAHGKVTSSTTIPELSDSFVTDIPADSNIFTGDEKRMPPDKIPMQTVPYYEVTVKKGNTTAVMAAFGYNGYIVLTNDLTSSSLTFNVGDTFTFIGGVNTAYLDDEHRTSQIIKNKVLSISFQPNYDSRFSSPLTARDFELVHFNTQTTEKSDDDINPNGFTAQKGDYRIVFTEDNGLRLPTTFKGGLYPKPKTIETDGDVSWAYPTLENNIGTLFNIVIDETWKTQAQLELKQRALSEIARLKKDLNKYSLPYNSVMYREAPLNLSVGQRVTYNNGQDLNGGSAYILQTQVIKLVTRLDKPEITTVTVGNEKIKGAIQTMKEQIETIIAGGVSSSSGGGMTESQFVNLLINHGDKRYIRRDINDETDTDITANKFVAKEGVKTDEITPKTPNEPISMNGDVDISGDSNVEGTLESKGATSLAKQGGKTTMGGNAEIRGNADVAGDVTTNENYQEMTDNTDGIGARMTSDGRIFAWGMQHGDPENPFLGSHFRTVVFGRYVPGLITGTQSGAAIFDSGHAKFKSVAIGGFLEVPEIRFNRATVYIGIGIRSVGGGIIEEVIPEQEGGVIIAAGRASVKLEDGEYGALELADKMLGFWHNEELPGQTTGNADAYRDDRNGDYELKGFQSVYFRIDGFYANEQDFKAGTNVIQDEVTPRGANKYFHYSLRTTGVHGWTLRHHPHQGMHFGLIANDRNTARQSLFITTTEYELSLQNLTDWNYDSSNIVKIDGKLDGFSMPSQRWNDQTQQYETYLKPFFGNGTVLGNAYIYGKLDQFERVTYRCYVQQSLNGSIGIGETEVETVSVVNGYGEDVTNQFTKFTVTRDSGDAASDAAWNAQHTNVGNPFSISSSDLGIDGIHRLSTQFYVTATDEATETITPAAILDFAA